MSCNKIESKYIINIKPNFFFRKNKSRGFKFLRSRKSRKWGRLDDRTGSSPGEECREEHQD